MSSCATRMRSILEYLRDEPTGCRSGPRCTARAARTAPCAALLEFLGIPFVGSRSDAARLAWDKPTAKVLVARAGVSTPAIDHAAPRGVP